MGMKASEGVIRSAGKGYGGDHKGGMGRGMFSMKQTKSPAPVPMKGSELNLSSPVQEKDGMKVKKMGKEQARREDLRGMAS